MGKPDATDEEIVTALKKANAYDFIMKHEEGVNLHVGTAGG
jgi:ABC-type multidrug transport system fused ATPase/permease subunit